MKRWLPTVGAVAFVLWMIGMANLGYAVEFFAAVRRIGADKLGHFGMMGGLAFCLNFSLGYRCWRRWLLGSVIVVVFSTVEEFSQFWIENRSFDLRDLASNYAGVFCASLLAGRSARAAGSPPAPAAP